MKGKERDETTREREDVHLNGIDGLEGVKSGLDGTMRDDGMMVRSGNCC